MQKFYRIVVEFICSYLKDLQTKAWKKNIRFSLKDLLDTVYMQILLMLMIIRFF